jgi:hypothetical protein
MRRGGRLTLYRMYKGQLQLGWWMTVARSWKKTFRLPVALRLENYLFAMGQKRGQNPT